MDYAGNSTVASKKVTTLTLQQIKKQGQKIVCLTAYDALISRILDESAVDLLLVGDSLGNVFQGLDTTLPVTLEETIYHTKAVVRGVTKRALVVADMPFMSFQVSDEEAFRNAGRIMKETGCAAVKLEGGKLIVEAVKRLNEAGIPVMGHLGLTPQSINKFGTYRVRGTNEEEAENIYNNAILLEKAGIFALVLEKIPSELAKKITENISIPTIGIGAGPHCDGQILVYTDMLGLTVDFNPRFVRRYAQMNQDIKDAVKKYGDDIRNNKFPNEDESY